MAVNPLSTKRCVPVRDRNGTCKPVAGTLGSLIKHVHGCVPYRRCPAVRFASSASMSTTATHAPSVATRWARGSPMLLTPVCVHALASRAFSAAAISAWRLATSVPIGGPLKRRRSKPNHTTAVIARNTRVIIKAASLGGCTPR